MICAEALRADLRIAVLNILMEVGMVEGVVLVMVATSERLMMLFERKLDQ